MSSIYARGNKLWFRVKGRDGKWKDMRSGFKVGEEEMAKAALVIVEEQLEKESGYGLSPNGPLTVRVYAARWLVKRKPLVKSWENDESRLKNYILPVIGDMPLGEVKPRHIHDLVFKVRTNETERKAKLAPKTIHNMYAALRALFRDAHIDGLIDQNPCILTEHHLGKKRDKDPKSRVDAYFVREEVEALISDLRIPKDRRILYALAALTGARHGEVVGLRWRDVNLDHEPLGKIVVWQSYDDGTNKTEDTRIVPIHPTLSVLLKDWKAFGWKAEYQHDPSDDDLVCPQPATARTPLHRMREVTRTLKQFHRDLLTLGLRKRTFHNLRRTLVSLSREEGADKAVLRRITHKGHGDVLESYTSYAFKTLCREMMKVKVSLVREAPLPPAEPLALASGDHIDGLPQSKVSGACGLDQPKFAAVLAAVEAQTQRSPGNLSASGASFLRGVGDLNP